MTYLTHDGSFPGILSCVFYAYEHKLTDEVHISRGNVLLPSLFVEKVKVETSPSKAQRVADKVIAIAGKSKLKDLWRASLSEIPDIGTTIFEVIQLLIKNDKQILMDYGHPAILKWIKVLKKISRERHRMTAFVRFELADDDTYYATIEPDFDVLPLIISHFKERYADQKWMIFDLKRNYGIYYDLNKVEVVEPTNDDNKELPIFSIQLNTDEKEFQGLWKNYFHATGIKERKNRRLHLRHVPKRYWRHLTEKQPA